MVGNVHSQGSKSFPRCIGRPDRPGGNPVEGTKELTFRDNSSSAAVLSSQLPGWELVFKSRQCPPHPLPTTMQKLTACAISQTNEYAGNSKETRPLKAWSFLRFRHHSCPRRHAGRQLHLTSRSTSMAFTVPTHPVVDGCGDRRVTICRAFRPEQTPSPPSTIGSPCDDWRVQHATI